MQRPSNLREAADKSTVASFLQSLKFFRDRKLKEVAVLGVVEGLEYQRLIEGQATCRLGDIGEQFFIVLSGECALYLPVNVPSTVIAAKFYGLVHSIERPEFGDDIPEDLKLQLFDRNRAVLKQEKMRTLLEGFHRLTRPEQQFFWQDFEYRCARKIANLLKSTTQHQNKIFKRISNIVAATSKDYSTETKLDAKQQAVS
jgi:hypothetical protein